MNGTRAARRFSGFSGGDVLVLLAALGTVLWLVRSIGTEMDYNWRWERAFPYLVYTDGDGEWRLGLILEGLATTVRLTVLGGIGALVIALPVALLQMLSSRVLRILGVTYVELLRNIPPLVFMFVFYYFISNQIMGGWELNAWASERFADSAAFWVLAGDPRLLENFLSGLICLMVFESAYVAEIYRAGIQSVPRGQVESGLSLGLRPLAVFRLVVMPQALRKVAPPLTSQVITLIKDSSIISVISIQELTFTGVEASVSSGQFFEVWLIVALLYFALSFPISVLFRKIEA